MDQTAEDSVLEALYKEASTRRHTADNKQAEVLAAESARRDASKLTRGTNSITALRLTRAVQQAFDRHSLAGTGLLTKAQLQATLHGLGMLASRPPVFSSTVHRREAAHSSTTPVCHSRRECSIVERLWQIFTSTVKQSDSTAALTCTNSSLPASRNAAAGQHAGSDEATADKADSSDSLLSESLDLWLQLTGEADLSLESVHAGFTRSPKALLPVHADSLRLSVAPLTVQTGESINSTADQHKVAPQQPKEARRSSARGVTLQQLLSFVQLVQQHSSGTGSVQAAASLQSGLSSQQVAELDKIARICCQNKQANMAYVRIGNTKPQQQLRGQHATALKGPVGTNKSEASASDRQGVLTSRWQPQGHAGKREATALASRAIRFSRRNFRQQQHQQPENRHTLVNALGTRARPGTRHKGSGSELGKQQPFARSESTAADVLKRRQALAELEMLPCTFHPALDPHSLAIVAAKASAYQPPQKGALPHRQTAHMSTVGLDNIPGSSAGLRPAQGAMAAAEAARTCIGLGPGGLAFIPDQSGLTSRDLLEQRALRDCSFAPRLNANNKARSIVAQTWKDAQPSHQCLALHQLHAAAADVLSNQAASLDGPEPKSQSLTFKADSGPSHNAGNDPQGVQEGTRVVHQQAAGDMKSSLRSSGRRPTQPSNSYVAAALRSRGHKCALCSTAPANRQQHQLDAMVDTSSAGLEAQLQADVADCDKRLEQCMQARHQAYAQQEAQLDSADTSDVKDNAGHEHARHKDGQLQQSALRVSLEAELKDGSSATFQVQQADQLRHLTTYFAAMMELCPMTSASKLETTDVV